MAAWFPYFHTAGTVLAGTWLGCLVFTTLVVSPALKGLEWPEPTRVLVRSRIGRQFRRLANPLLVLLTVAVVLAGITSRPSGWSLARYVAQLVLLLLLGVLAGVHGFFLGTRLQRLAATEQSDPGGDVAGARAARHRLQRLSFAVSIADLVVSLLLAILVAIG